MSDSNELKRAIDGRDVALVILTLGGVGGYLWLDHKLRIEQKTNAELNERLMQLAANQIPGAPPAKPAAARMVLPPGAVPQALLSQMTSGAQALPAAAAAASTPRRNAPSLARLPRIELAPRTYDEVFDRYGRGLPVAYLRALALHESDMRPRLADGPSWGLLQVIEVVREDFNRRERANFTRQDLLDPAINVMIAASAIALIVKSYAANHPSTPNLQPDWRNPQFVALVTFGWNAGWSERGGVGRVASFLEQRGADVTINSVFDAAKAAGASPHLSNPMKLAFAKQVTRQYFAELADEERLIEIETPVARAPSDRPAVVVDVGSSSPASSAAPVEMPVIVVESPPVPSAGPESAPGPITSPSQLEHDVSPPVLGPIEHPDFGLAVPPIVPPIVGPPVPVMPPVPAPIVAPPIAAPAMPAYPSGGSGPIDPYGEPVPPIEHYGYPEDPYAYSYSPGAAPHA
ncbi:MAG: hypothetical protein ACRDKI_12515 [Solirubrobacterales bacterium]